MARQVSSDLRAPGLAGRGRSSIEWADARMPALRALHAGGGEIGPCASNPLSTQNDVVHVVLPAFDRRIDRLKPASMGVRIDEPTRQQEDYLSSWSEGT